MKPVENIPITGSLQALLPLQSTRFSGLTRTPVL